MLTPLHPPHSGRLGASTLPANTSPLTQEQHHSIEPYLAGDREGSWCHHRPAAATGFNPQQPSCTSSTAREQLSLRPAHSSQHGNECMAESRKRSAAASASSGGPFGQPSLFTALLARHPSYRVHNRTQGAPPCRCRLHSGTCKPVNLGLANGAASDWNR